MLDLVDRTAPDLILVDLELHQHILPLRAQGRRLALLNTWLEIDPRSATLPLHLPISPDAADAGRQAKRAWRRYQGAKKRRALREWAREAGADWRTSLLTLARNNGLEIKAEIDFQSWLYPFSYRNIPILTLHAAELDYPRLPVTGSTFVGPMISPADDDVPWLEKFMTTGRPLVYAGFGSFFTASPNLVAAVFEALSQRPDWHLVFSLGGRPAPDLLPPPSNVRVIDWAPQTSILERADAAIIHGGINTIEECVQAKVPMIVYPQSVTDMPGNGARVAWNGFGEVGDPQDGAEALLARLDRVVASQDIANRLAQASERLERYRDDRVLEQTINRLLTT
ncbi:MAG: nucleotide disphospho-sugar-binding domain-containing protein [Pseudomonadota bacterium]